MTLDEFLEELEELAKYEEINASIPDKIWEISFMKKTITGTILCYLLVATPIVLLGVFGLFGFVLVM